ncbi:MAG: DUF4123 domain-containing protein [Flavobacteriales bacterium]
MATNSFLLLDAARMHGDIHRARELNPEHTCLYEGDSERFLSAVAPWLFSLAPHSPFAQWLVENGAGQSWGVVFQSDADPVKLYKHLRSFLIVEGEDGREMYFRYYDPRVLRVFLPTCEPEQLAAFFGPIAMFLAEDVNGLVVEFTLTDQGTLEVVETGKKLVSYLSGGPPGVIEERGSDEGQVARKKNWDFGY